MPDQTSLTWLQGIETSLQTSIAILTVKYESAALGEKAQIFWTLSKLNERRATVHSAIIDLLQNRLAFSPPSPQTIDRTKKLTDNLQELVRNSNRYEAILKLLTDLSSLLTDVVVEFPMPRLSPAVRESARA